MAEGQKKVSRWCIKPKSLDDQLVACRKSLAAAERGGRDGLIASLRVKLSQLETQQHDGAPMGEAEPPTRLVVKRKKKRAKQKVDQEDQKAVVQLQMKQHRGERLETESGDDGDSDGGTVSGDGAGDRQTAVDILLRAKAARGSGSESSDDDGDVGLPWWKDPEFLKELKEDRCGDDLKRMVASQHHGEEAENQEPVGRASGSVDASSASRIKKKKRRRHV